MFSLPFLTESANCLMASAIEQTKFIDRVMSNDEPQILNLFEKTVKMQIRVDANFPARPTGPVYEAKSN